MVRIRNTIADICRRIANWFDEEPALHIYPIDEHRIALGGTLKGNMVVHGGITTTGDLILVDEGEVRVPLK